jgi:hypothetical protein
VAVEHLHRFRERRAGKFQPAHAPGEMVDRLRGSNRDDAWRGVGRSVTRNDDASAGIEELRVAADDRVRGGQRDPAFRDEHSNRALPQIDGERGADDAHLCLRQMRR